MVLSNSIFSFFKKLKLNNNREWFLENKSVFITSQNHGFTISEKSLNDNVEVTHRSLFDKSIQGISSQNGNVFGFQGHPEASPGPKDIQSLFDKFIFNIKKFKEKN